MKISRLKIGGRTIKTVVAVFLCVVFLCITVTHGNDVNLLAFGTARILDITIGIMIALIINQFPIRRTIGRHIWIKGKGGGYCTAYVIIGNFDNLPMACKIHRKSQRS